MWESGWGVVLRCDRWLQFLPMGRPQAVGGARPIPLADLPHLPPLPALNPPCPCLLTGTSPRRSAMLTEGPENHGNTRSPSTVPQEAAPWIFPGVSK